MANEIANRADMIIKFFRESQRISNQPRNPLSECAIETLDVIGALKNRAGTQYFLMRGLQKCRGEFSLMVMAYNFSRLLTILGVARLQDYCAQRQEKAAKNLKYA